MTSTHLQAASKLLRNQALALAVLTGAFFVGCGADTPPVRYGGGAAGATLVNELGGASVGGATLANAEGGASAGGAASGNAGSGTVALGGGTDAGGTATAGGTAATAGAGAANARILMHADFQSRSPGLYTQSMVNAEFSGAPTWNDGMDEGRASIVDESGERFLRVTYSAGVYGPADGGVQFIVPLGGQFEELYLSYRIRFAVGFDFVRGGKLPGLVGGTHPTGCVTDEGGFSARMMWRSLGAAVQYLYFPEKVNSCGDDYAYTLGNANVTFIPGRWHRVQHRIRMNAGGQHDGILQAWFDGASVLDNRAFLYRVATATFGIDALYFSTFFGGSDSTWAPTQAQVADFDDFIVSDQPIL